jgi:hypothetical protein
MYNGLNHLQNKQSFEVQMLLHRILQSEEFHSVSTVYHFLCESNKEMTDAMINYYDYDPLKVRIKWLEKYLVHINQISVLLHMFPELIRNIPGGHLILILLTDLIEKLKENHLTMRIHLRMIDRDGNDKPN